jgi:hypothetical protein
VIEELEDTHINLMGIHDNEAIFLTQEEQELFLLNQTKVSEEAEDAKQQAFENAILEVHRQYNLRSKRQKGVQRQKGLLPRRRPKHRRQSKTRKPLNLPLIRLLRRLLLKILEKRIKMTLL